MSLWARLIFDIYLESHGAIYMYLYYMKLHRTLILMNQHYFIVIYGLDWRCSFSEYFISEYSQSSARQPQDLKVLSRNLFDSQCQSKITLRNKHKWKLELQSRRNNVYEEKNKNKNSPWVLFRGKSPGSTSTFIVWSVRVRMAGRTPSKRKMSSAPSVSVSNNNIVECSQEMSGIIKRILVKLCL